MANNAGAVPLGSLLVEVLADHDRMRRDFRDPCGRTWEGVYQGQKGVNSLLFHLEAVVGIVRDTRRMPSRATVRKDLLRAAAIAVAALEAFDRQPPTTPKDGPTP